VGDERNINEKEKRREDRERGESCLRDGNVMC
jgi:hypothetical protein